MTVDPRDIPEAHNEIERAVIGSAILNPVACAVGIHLLGPNGCFQNPLHATIWHSVVSLTHKGLCVDYVSVLSDLEASGKNSNNLTGYVTSLMHGFAFTGNMATYCEQLLTFQRRLSLLDDVEELRAALRANAPMPEIQRLANRVEQASMHNSGAGVPDEVSEIIGKHVDTLVSRLQNGVEPGVKTGFPMIDSYTGGMKPGEVIIVAARTGVGKSAILINIALNVGLAGGRVVLYSLEMSQGQVLNRMLSASISRNLRKGIRKEDIEEVLRPAVKAMIETKIALNCTPSIGLDAIRESMARYIARNGPPALIIVDYLQLVTVSGRRSRYEEVGEVSRGLKQLASQSGCPVVAAAQLSRESERAGKVQMSHLRESGSIEQDANVIMLVEMAENSTEAMDVHIAKNRDGEVGTVQLIFEKSTQRIRGFGQHGPLVTTASTAPKVWPKTTELDYSEPDDDGEIPF